MKTYHLGLTITLSDTSWVVLCRSSSPFNSVQYITRRYIGAEPVILKFAKATLQGINPPRCSDTIKRLTAHVILSPGRFILQISCHHLYGKYMNICGGKSCIDPPTTDYRGVGEPDRGVPWQGTNKKRRYLHSLQPYIDHISKRSRRWNDTINMRRQIESVIHQVPATFPPTGYPENIHDHHEAEGLHPYVVFAHSRWSCIHRHTHTAWRESIQPSTSLISSPYRRIYFLHLRKMCSYD